MNDNNKKTDSNDQKPVEVAKTEDAAKTEEVKVEAAK